MLAGVMANASDCCAGAVRSSPQFAYAEVVEINPISDLHETRANVILPTRAPTSPAARRMLFALATVAVSLAAATEAPEMPTLRQGLWSYQRVTETPGRAMARPVSTSKCVDPSADLKEKLQSLKARNCTVSAIVRNGNEYAWTVACPVNGEMLAMRSVITVESDIAFREEMSARWASQNSRSTQSARRIGDCAEKDPQWLHHRPRGLPWAR
jgi:hypothetical protein